MLVICVFIVLNHPTVELLSVCTFDNIFVKVTNSALLQKILYKECIEHNVKWEKKFQFLSNDNGKLFKHQLNIQGPSCLQNCLRPYLVTEAMWQINREQCPIYSTLLGNEVFQQREFFPVKFSPSKEMFLWKPLPTLVVFYLHFGL